MNTAFNYTHIHLCVLSALRFNFSNIAFAEEKEVINLPEVTVTEKQIDDTYYAPIANSATKTDAPVIETPVSIQVVPEAVLVD